MAKTEDSTNFQISETKIIKYAPPAIFLYRQINTYYFWKYMCPYFLLFCFFLIRQPKRGVFYEQQRQRPAIGEDWRFHQFSKFSNKKIKYGPRAIFLYRQINTYYFRKYMCPYFLLFWFFLIRQPTRVCFYEQQRPANFQSQQSFDTPCLFLKPGPVRAGGGPGAQVLKSLVGGPRLKSLLGGP